MTYLFEDQVKDTNWIKVEASSLREAFLKYIEYFTRNEDDKFIRDCCTDLDIELIDMQKVECYE